jgi:Pathogenicity locus
MKAKSARDAKTLESIPNIGKSIANDLRGLGIHQPLQLCGLDPYKLYQDIAIVTGVRHDPCLCDVFIAAIKFMEGGPPLPWWYYTAERKRNLQKSKI